MFAAEHGYLTHLDCAVITDPNSTRPFLVRIVVRFLVASKNLKESLVLRARDWIPCPISMSCL